MEDLRMLDKKEVTAEAVKLLLAIMRTCPPTIFNGGDAARAGLAKLSNAEVTVSGRELRGFAQRHGACECESGGELDVYSHLLLHAEGELIEREDVLEYFASQVHAARIFENARKDFVHGYALKIVYGHLLVPVYLEKAKEGIGRDYYGNVISGLLKFPDARFVDHQLVAMHYGFLVDKLSFDEAELIAECNLKSGLFKSALEILEEPVDFAKMHHYPRSLKMAREN